MTEEQAVAAVVSAFCIDGQLKSAERYGSGHIHDTYSVRFENDRSAGHILLQRINTRIFKNPLAVMENIERVTTHIRMGLNGVSDVDRRVLQLVRTDE